jgi:hypothetical protein
MSDDTTLQKYLRRNRSESLSNGADEDGTEQAETVAGCFGFLRGARERAMCLELRRKSGQILAINYSYVSRFEYQPDVGILLHCSGDKIKITGTNLNATVGSQLRLFEALCRHKVPWLSESDRTERMSAGSNGVVITTIEWDLLKCP